MTDHLLCLFFWPHRLHQRFSHLARHSHRLPSRLPPRCPHQQRRIPLSRHLVVACLLLVQAGCWHTPQTPSPPSGATGEIAVAAHVSSAPNGGDSLSTPAVLDIVLQQGALVLERSLEVLDGRAIGTLSGIYEGHWEVQFFVRDLDGVLTHRGETELTVIASQSPLLLEIVLEPLPGRLHVQADLTDFSGAAKVGRARLVQHPEGERHESIRADGENTILWDVELPAGTYDLQIQLFGETFHSHRHVYSSGWISVDIWAGREAVLRWSPATGEVEFVGVIHTLPAAPQNLTAAVVGEEIVLQWANVSGDAPEAILFWKADPLQRFEELVTLPVQPLPFPGEPTTSIYRHRPREDGMIPPATLTYAVVAVDAAGRRSLRTAAQPVEWNPDD